MTDERNQTPTTEDFPAAESNIRCEELQAQLNAAETRVRDIKDKLDVLSRSIATEQLKKIPLHVLNKQARDSTKIETKRRFRAQEALDGLLNHFVPGRKEHPPLFQIPEKE